MSIKHFITAVMLGSMVLYVGCAKPPTEKANALQSDLKSTEAKGAKIFAPAEYDQVAKKMAELQNLMGQKKNRMATALADSIAPQMAALKATVDNNSKSMSQQAVSAASGELGKFKALLTPENMKLLGEGAKACQARCAEFESKVNEVQNTLSSGDLLNAYNNAQQLAGQIAAAVQDDTQKIEQAKAKEAEKAAKKGKGKAAVKAAPKAAAKAAVKAAPKATAKAAPKPAPKKK